MAVTQIEITESIARKVLSIVDAGLVKGVGEPKPGEMCVEAAVNYALGLPHGDDPQCVSRALRVLKITLNDKEWSSNQARAKGLRRLAVAQLGSRDHFDDVEFVKRVATLAIRTCIPQALRAAASIQKDRKHQQEMRNAADKCEREATRANALEARKIAYAAAVAAAVAAVAAGNASAYAADAAYAAAYAAANAAAYAADADANAAYAAANAAAYDAAYAAANVSAKKTDLDKSLADFAEGVVQILIEMKAPGCQWLALAEQEAA